MLREGSSAGRALFPERLCEEATHLRAARELSSVVGAGERGWPIEQTRELALRDGETRELKKRERTGGCGRGGKNEVIEAGVKNPRRG